MKKLTIVAGSTNRLLDVLIDEMTVHNWEVCRVQQCFEYTGSRWRVWSCLLVKIFFDFLSILRSRPDITAFHSFTVQSFITSVLLAVTRQRYVIHFWGSDYFYWKTHINPLFQFVLKQAVNVTFANSQMLREAQQVFKPDIPYRLLRFGLEAISLIDRYGFGFGGHSRRYLRVVVGTNSQLNQQHLEIIEQLERTDAITRAQCLFIFPLNYGDQTNRQKVLSRLSKVNFTYEVLDQYIQGKELAEFRSSTNILIQLQKTDAMSGAMLETLYAGGMVITGTWLPYDDLRSAGVEWFEITRFSELPQALNKAANQTINRKRNKEVVSEIARWSDLSPAWDIFYYEAASRL